MIKMTKDERIRELITTLNKAADSYYSRNEEIISNFEYDALYDELLTLEKETGTVYENSPTQRVFTEQTVSKLRKVRHEYPALSLNKTKSADEIAAWLGDKSAVLSWKCDGLTVVATYQGGRLVSVCSRGDGETGEDVTHNAVYFKGLPRSIAYKGKLIVRGEALMKFSEFERINSLVPETEAKYKNPRNLASSTVRMLDSRESREREIHVSAFDLVYTDNEEQNAKNSLSSNLDYLEKSGFEVVEHCLVTSGNAAEKIEEFKAKLPSNDFPSDGLVFVLDDIKYGKQLGSTGKFPRNGMAFKWEDATEITTIREIEWSPSRTGLLNPVAIFDTVELEGTEVSRASVHNVSVAQSLMLGVGSQVEVYKANMIIPQIAKTVKSTGETVIPRECPLCGGETSIKDNDGIKTLYCMNPACPAKNVGKFAHFCERDSMNIIGLSEATLEKFVDAGFIKTLADIYRLDRYKDEITALDGFGEKAYGNIIDAVNVSRNTTFSAFIGSLGIPNVGKNTGKLISSFFGENALGKFLETVENGGTFAEIDGIGGIVSDNIISWMNENRAEFDDLLSCLNVSDDAVIAGDAPFAGKTFVITGAVYNYPNRDAVKAEIESLGGKVASSVSAKTDYLINNDVNSTSGKNKKAKELGIPVISEEEYMAMLP